MDKKKIETDSIEKRLDSILRPVSPEESYINGLKNRLSYYKSMVAIEKPDYFMVILLICSFFIFGLIVFWFFKLIFNQRNRFGSDEP